jgi:hypothetical protein
MNLVELLLAGLVFALASAGSLEVMAGLGRALGGEQQAELAGERLEAELRRSQAQVRAGAQQQPFTDLACEAPDRLLLHLLGESAASPGDPQATPGGDAEAVQRQVSLVAPGLVRLQVSLAQGRWQRQRLFSTAAYGLCPGPGEPVG